MAIIKSWSAVRRAGDGSLEIGGLIRNEATLGTCPVPPMHDDAFSEAVQRERVQNIDDLMSMVRELDLENEDEIIRDLEREKRKLIPRRKKGAGPDADTPEGGEGASARACGRESGA